MLALNRLMRYNASVIVNLKHCSHNAKQPTKTAKERLLRSQRGRCFYCGLEFGDFFKVGIRLYPVRLHWEHLVPFAYAFNNADENFVAACDLCNQLKQDKVFDTINDAIIYVRHQRKKRKYPSKKLPECDLWGIIHSEEAVAEILPIKVQARTFLDDA